MHTHYTHHRLSCVRTVWRECFILCFVGGPLEIGCDLRPPTLRANPIAFQSAPTLIPPETSPLAHGIPLTLPCDSLLFPVSWSVLWGCTCVNIRTLVARRSSTTTGPSRKLKARSSEEQLTPAGASNVPAWKLALKGKKKKESQSAPTTPLASSTPAAFKRTSTLGKKKRLKSPVVRDFHSSTGYVLVRVIWVIRFLGIFELLG